MVCPIEKGCGCPWRLARNHTRPRLVPVPGAYYCSLRTTAMLAAAMVGWTDSFGVPLEAPALAPTFRRLGFMVIW